MSILIKGMEMPNEGAERCIVIRGDGTICTFTGALIDYVTVVPVPPHGGLIDADKLKVQMKNRRNMIGRPSDPDCLVMDAPIIIPAEE